MHDWMKLMTLKKISALAAVITIAASLVPKSAQAQNICVQEEPNEPPLCFPQPVVTDPGSPILVPGDLLAFLNSRVFTASQISDTTFGNNISLDNSFLGGVQYVATLEDTNSSNILKFALLVKPNVFDGISDPINFLSTTGIPGEAGVEYLAFVDVNNTDNYIPASFDATQISKPVAVPEPDKTGGLLAAAALGIVLMMKRMIASPKS